MGRKQNLAGATWYPKLKLGVTTHFFEIIKLPFGKERHTLLCILKLFTNIVDYLSLKNAWLPQFSFWISIILVNICFSRTLINQAKISLNYCSRHRP